MHKADGRLEAFTRLTRSATPRRGLSRLLLTWLGAALLLVAGAMHAGAAPDSPVSQPLVLLELFTSQGCAACPPADRLLGELAARQDVVVVSYPVDYWDYLGWQDTLASHANSERQRLYALQLGEGMVYTPQLVVDGRRHVNGADRRAVAAAIEARLGERRSEPGDVRLSLAAEGDSLRLQVAGTLPTAAPPATLWFAEVASRQAVEVRGGENGGRELVYHHIAHELLPVGEWSGQPTDIRLPRDKLLHHRGDRCIAILQAGKGGPVLAVAQLRLR